MNKASGSNGHHAEPVPRPAPARPPERELVIPEIEDKNPTGRFGAVSKGDALVIAQKLGRFTRIEFSNRSGLDLPASSRWLGELTQEGVLSFSTREAKFYCVVAPKVRDWVVWYQEEALSAERVAEACQLSPEEALKELEALEGRKVVRRLDDGLFQYVPVESWQGPREHHTLPPPERTTRPAYELAPPDRGMPVRVSAVKKATRQQRSTSGAGGVHGAKQTDARYNKMQEAKAKRAAERSAKAKATPNPNKRRRAA